MKDYQVMPPLSQEDFEILKADIRERGVQVPIELDEDGNILDGYHRMKACEELGIVDYPTVIRDGMTEEEKRSHARRLNLMRRHLSQEQKRKLISEQLTEAPEKSDRQTAAALGVSHVTVGVVRREMESGGQIDHLKTVRGADGKEYPRQNERQPKLRESADTCTKHEDESPCPVISLRENGTKQLHPGGQAPSGRFNDGSQNSIEKGVVTADTPEKPQGDISFMQEPGYLPPEERVRRDPCDRLYNVIYKFSVIVNAVTKWEGMETAIKRLNYNELAYISASLHEILDKLVSRGRRKGNVGLC